MIYFYIPLISTALILIIFLISNKFDTGFISENISPNSRKIHTHKIIRLGSLSFLSFLLVYLVIEENILRNFVFFSFLIFIIGFSEDLIGGLNNILRFIILSLIVLYFVTSNSYIINDFDNYFLNLIINYSSITSIIFILLGYLILINGFNFIDGLNGLMLGFAIIILMHFLYYVYQNPSELRFVIILLILSIVPLFIVNIVWGKILAGDGGSYFIGSIIGSICIYIANTGVLTSMHVACIIFYPTMEVIVSFFRRVIINKKSPFLPDELHLHIMLYKLLQKKFNNGNFLFNLNSFLSLIIIIIFLSINSVLIVFKNNLNYEFLFFILCFIYFISYLKIYNSYTASISK